jgi:ribosomal-protein-alanine N-acetyltransferase
MPQNYEILRTQRLDLYCLTAEELFAIGEKDDVFAGRSFENPHGVITGEKLPRTNRVQDVREHPENIKWYYRMIVDRERNMAVGSVSFHGAPDERGMIEIGIGISPEEQGQGFASEALLGMWNWAAHQPGVKFLRYTVSPNNRPSIAIIKKFEFPQIGEQIDEEDGLELIFETTVEDYLDWL